MAGVKFRVLLDSNDKNEIFRDILIDDEATFETFYKAIINSFNFNGDQMASFYVSNDEWDKGHEISLMDMSYGDDSVDALPSVMRDAVIKNFIEEPDQKFILVYDFLRMWIFLAELVGYEENAPETPEVVLAIGIAPPEDSKEMNLDGEDDLDFDDMEDEDEDDFGFNDFDDDYSDDDMAGFDSYE
jgi:hypothetical protein